MTLKPASSIVLLLLFVLPAGAQPAPPTAFRAIALGDPLSEVKSELAADTTFAYRGDPDVSLLPLDRQTLIETEGRRFIGRAFFQFYEGLLYSITLQLNEAEVDFYTMYTTLTEKYGSPTSLDPREVVWLSEEVRFSLERPLTVKYVDYPVYRRRIDEQEVGESMDEFTRERFLGQF